MLNLMYITNNPEIALIAEKNGVNRIFVDLETLGKEERQKNMNSVKSHHTVDDVKAVSSVLTKSELLVRVNPWHENSVNEIDAVISAGADRIMLPMWKSAEEVSMFLNAVNGRTGTTLLLETKEAASCIDVVLDNEKLDEIHIGLNDLHLSYGLTFMFELISNGVVESLCSKMRNKGIKYGFGGIARIGEGTLPAENILYEHIRLGSTAVILSRSFFDCSVTTDYDCINDVFNKEIKKLRSKESELSAFDVQTLQLKHMETAEIISSIVSKLRRDRA